ncbi:hypothetical protein SK128_000090 [Halocaridina rubra]|uniref:Uncharacterized protein n=1 Tax=Halocaridina rubra TaxID=373956 RepID=A0AAN8WJN4_HALRR
MFRKKYDSNFLPCLRNSLHHIYPQAGQPAELSLTLSTFKAKVPILQDTYIKEPWTVLDIISWSTGPIHFLQLPQVNIQTPTPQHHEICRVVLLALIGVASCRTVRVA